MPYTFLELPQTVPKRVWLREEGLHDGNYPKEASPTRKTSTTGRKKTASAKKAASRKKAPALRKKSSAGASKKKTSTTRKKTPSRKKSTRKYSAGASDSVRKEMEEYNSGSARSGRSGAKVKSRKQAIAIGLSEARASGKKVPPKPNGRSRKKKTS